MTGNRFPVAELKEATGLPILIDGAQSVGAIPVDASGFDYYAFSCQKWLCGPDSMGGLCARRPGLAAARPLRATSRRPATTRRAASSCALAPAASTRAGRPLPRWPGLAAALDSRPDWAFEHAAKTTARCRELLAERAEVVTAGEPATLVTFRVEEDSAELVKRLYDAGVVVRDIPGQGLIRVSCGWWTSEDDLQRLLAAL